MRPSQGAAGQQGAPQSAPPPPASDIGSRINYLFTQVANSIENGVEKGLDMVLGAPTEEGIRGSASGNAAKKKARNKKRQQREERRRREAEAQLLKKYQDEQKAKMVAKLVKEQEEEKAKYEKELQESEESNRTLILQFTLVQVGGLYAVSQACLLSIFVAQKCPAIDANYTSPWFDYTSTEPDGHLCTMKENLDWYNFTDFNKAVFVINVMTLALMLSAQSYFWKREVWFVEHLEEDNSIPYDSLPKELEGYEAFQAEVKNFNVGGYAYATALALLIMLNLSLSTYFLVKGDGVYNYNIGSRTYTGLITNTMLVSTKIVGFWSCAPENRPPGAIGSDRLYARLSYTHDWAISMFTVIPLSYNRVDHEYMVKDWKTEEQMQAELNAVAIEPAPPDWGRRPGGGGRGGVPRSPSPRRPGAAEHMA